MAEVFRFYEDPGHGWLAVPFDTLEHVGLSLDGFSECSRIHEWTIYLEEDCDAPKFKDAWEASGKEMFAVQVHGFDVECYVRQFFFNTPMGRDGNRALSATAEWCRRNTCD